MLGFFFQSCQNALLPATADPAGIPSPVGIALSCAQGQGECSNGFTGGMSLLMSPSQRMGPTAARLPVLMSCPYGEIGVG